MAQSSGETIGWTAELQGDKTVVAQHPDGHKIRFAFSADGKNEVYIQSQQWAAEGDHSAELAEALRISRPLAKAKGWTY